MGVPKFFRYISERYPCLSDVVREHEIPEFDNLYLDMNGIIHVCSHPNDFDPHFRITEESIFTDIFHYIEILFRMIQPKRLFFMAVDGVAPRAKMNQQRGRRFRSAKDAEVLEAKAKANGEVLPDAERFDSNCITPGTTFMARLHAQLKYFVSYKISTDKLWQKPTIILSGHETPGEGEHKIMDYIRYLKSKPDYDPDTRHCLYGLDADLIMLGLCTHEPHFALLREEVKFGKNSKDKHFKRSSVPEEIKFYLLHLSLMREYIEIEFQDLKKTLPFPFDLESIIDDWVLMGFLVGNDFIPHLPNLHIASGALPLLYKAYIDVLPTLGGYINEGGSLNLPRFQKYMEKLGAFDISQFRDTYADLKYFQEKTGRRPNEKERTSYKNNGESNAEVDGQPAPTKNPDLAALIQSTDNMMAEMEGDEQEMYFSSDEEGDENAIMFAEFYQHKNDYYINKLEYEKVTPEVLRSQAEGYVRAIQWNLNYYYNGCCSWSWFYPHHYAPFISDITNFKDIKLEFDGGEPFLPFQQLLAVLPAASKKLLPEPFQELMVNDDSPIISFYPTDFKTDMNGKKQEWEAVVLIPFINQDSLLKAMATKYDRLTDEEKRRNSHGPMLVYNYTPFKQGSYEAPEYFPTLSSNYAKETRVNREEIFVDEIRLVKGLCPGVRLQDYFPGFPSLRHLEFTATLKKAKVKVFDQPSRGENTILTLKENPNLSDDVLTVASIMLDKIVFVNYPQLIQAKVVAVADENKRVILRPSSDGSKSMVTEDMNSDLAQQWNLSKKSIGETHLQRLGIEIGNTKILVYASSLEGQKFVFSSTGKISTEKQWTKIPSSFALQTIVRNIVYAEREMDQTLTIDDLFKPSTTCFSLGTPHYGAMGTVMEGGKNGRIKLSVVAMVEPDLEPAMEVSRRCRSSYVPGHIMAQRLGISSHLLSRITGSIFVVNNSDPSIENVQKTNIGLNLKFTKRNEEVCGYTRKDNNQWLYSPKAEQLINNYMRMVPDVIQHISTFVFNDVYNINEMFPENSSEQLKRLVTWLNEQDFMKAERLTCGSVVLEEEVVDVIEKIIDYTKNKTAKTVTMQIKPHLLLLPKTNITGLCPDGNAVHKVFDRIVCIRESYSVPLGLKGTIIGIQSAEKEDDVIYDIVFDKEFVGGIQLRCSNNRGYRMTRKGFLNLSYGLRLETNKNKSGAAVTDYERFIENNPWNNKRNSAFTVCNNSSTNNLNKNHNQPFRQQPQPLIQHPKMPPHQSNAQPSQNSKQKMQSVEHLFPKFAQSNANNPSAGQSSPSNTTSEFQAMWNELKKAGPKPSNPVVKKQSQNNDPSDMLKKMLKIADASPKKKQLVPSKENARVADKSSDNDTNNVVLLEDYLKERDVDKPVYTYSYDIVRGNTLVTAKLFFEGESDEESTFVGSPSADIQSAAESAALNALNYLKLNNSLLVGSKSRIVSGGSHGKPQPSAQPSSNIYVPPNRMQMPMPFNNSRQQQNSYQQHQQFRGRNNSNNDNTFNWFNPELPTPPQQWYQQNYSDSRHMDWKLRPDFPSHQMPVPPFHNHPQHLQPNNHYGRSNSKPPGSTTNWRQVRPILPMVPSQNPFVPLQAITQCRTRPSTCSNFISKNTPENHQSQEQVKPQNISSPGQHSRPPTVMSQPRKSRIAAKFKMDVE